MVKGIYTLANDKVIDQLIALLNSIEANAGQHYPVCVIAYNDQTELVEQEVKNRSGVTLLNDPNLFKVWEDFSYDVWSSHPTALSDWQKQGIATRFYRVGENHRYCGFDEAAPFDQFLYLDADTLVMGPLEPFFEALSKSDFVVYDFQFKDPSHIFNVSSDRLENTFNRERLATEIFCSGCYASKKGIFSKSDLSWVVSKLQEGDADVLYVGAPNQSVLNYMVMKTGRRVHNIALEKPFAGVTGNSVTSSHFEPKDSVLYDKDVRLTYLHYIGVSSKFFAQVCKGVNVEFPYRDIFLHYRYLKEPEDRPELAGKAIPYQPKPLTLPQRVMKKIGLFNQR
jgi:hypothetical protein